MFALKSLGNFFFGGNSKEHIVELPQGQLFIVRPLSPKGYSELIFKGRGRLHPAYGSRLPIPACCPARIRGGRAELLEDEEGGEGTTDRLADKDERIFLLDEELHFRVDLNDTGENILAWRDLSGDPGDLFEFVCDPSTRPEAAQQFELVAAQCSTSGSTARATRTHRRTILGNSISRTTN